MSGDSLTILRARHRRLAKLIAADGTVQGHHVATGVRPRFLHELVAHGITIPGSYFDPSKPL